MEQLWSEQQSTTRALISLLNIISDDEIWLGKRIEACEAILGFEAPAETVEVVKLFLHKVAESDGSDMARHRVTALKLLRKAEARRVNLGTAPPASDIEARREQARRMARTNRRMALIKAGQWPPPKGWTDDIDCDANIEPVAPHNPVGMADRHEAARLAIEARRRRNGDDGPKAA